MPLLVSALLISSALALFCAIDADREGYEGTLGATTINSVQDLIDIKDDLNGNYILGSNITITGNFTPIGGAGDPFTGKFDGDNKTITLNISVGKTDADAYAGLFGYTEGAEIKDLKINGTVSAATSLTEEPPISLASYAGTIVGKAVDTTITNCHSTATVTSSHPARAYAGGIAGHAINSVMENCGNTGKVTATGAEAYAGGIAGHAEGNLGGSTMKGCYNHGAVTATGGVGNDNFGLAGGIVGRATLDTVSFSFYVVIKECYNAGTVTATGKESDAGGIAGKMSASSSIKNCYNVAAVTATGEKPSAGGIAGNVSGSPATIENCYNVATVTATGGSSGGIVGAAANLKIIHCYFLTGKVSNNKICGTDAGGVVIEGTGVQSSGAKSVGSMKQTLEQAQLDSSIYFNWDFGETAPSVWTADEEKNNGYPILLALADTVKDWDEGGGGSGGIPITVLIVGVIVVLGIAGAAVYFFILRK